MVGAILQSIRRMRSWQIVLLSVLASEILTGLIVAVMDLLLNGVVTWDFIITGAVAALMVSSIVVAILMSALKRMVEQETVLRRAEAELDENRERYRQIFQQAVDYILILESPEGGSFVITDASDSAFEKHGYTREEMLGKPITFLVSESLRKDALVKERFDLIRSGKAVKFETEHARKDGTVFNLEVVARMITINGKACVYTVERDITDRKELENRQLVLLSTVEHALTQAQIERNNALAANKVLSEFVANVSHELNTPLTSVLGYSHLAKDRDSEAAKILSEIIGLSRVQGGAKPDAVLEKIAGMAEKAWQAAEDSKKCESIVMTQGQRLYTLIGDLIDLSSLEAGRLRLEELAVSTYLLLDSMEQTHGKQAMEKNISLKSNSRDFLANDMVFLGDAKKVEKILEHLVENAIKYSNKGEITVTGNKENGSVVFRVRDRGIGINESEREKIFETFRQVDGSSTRAQGGLGLGLSLVKKLVSAMNGRIELKSEKGAGSEFAVFLPYRPVIPR